MAAIAGKVRALYGFSRGTQATLSVAQPLLGVFIASNKPPLDRLVLVVVASIAGYFAVFAANDVLDIRLDRRRLAFGGEYEAFDIDGAGSRHPLATGELKVAVAGAWVVVLGLVAVVLAAILNPVCAVLFLIAVALEVCYCLLATITPFKFVVTGIMVPVGVCIGWLAVRAAIDWPVLGLLFVWMAVWEIGGRNIPGDWADVDEDIQLGIKTVPVVFGFRTSGVLIFGFLLAAVLASAALTILAWPSLGAVGLVGAVLAGGYALVLPGIRLLRDPTPSVALRLFNSASLYPSLMLIIIVVDLSTRHLLPG